MPAFRMMLLALKRLYEELFHLLLMGLLTILGYLLLSIPAVWLLLSLQAPWPLIALAGLLLSLPGAIANAGLWGVAQAIVKETTSISWPFYWKAIKSQWKLSVSSYVLILAGYLLILSNLLFYNTTLSPLPPHLNPWAIGIWAGLGVLWSGIAFYLLAFQMELEKPKLLLALRNSFLMVLLHPIEVFIWLVTFAVCSVLMVFLPLLIALIPPLAAILSFGALQVFLEPIREKQQSATDKE